MSSELWLLADIYFSRPSGAFLGPLRELDRDVRTVVCPVSFLACTGLGGVPRPVRDVPDLLVREGLNGCRHGGL